MNAENAPKDMLRYVAKFLDLRDIITCRAVCQRWKEIIDDSEQDSYLFRHFTFDMNHDNSTGRIYYQAAKDAFVAAKSLDIQMNDDAPLYGQQYTHNNSCCNSCCNSCDNFCYNNCCCSCCSSYDNNALLATLILLVGCLTCCFCCCGCCGCCGKQKFF
jgi:hypothetical protein